MLKASEGLAGTALLVMLCVACRRPVPPPAIIGVAYPSWSAPYIAEAESTLRREWGDTAILPRFAFDSVVGPETADRVVTWTQALLRMPGLAVIVGPSASHTALAVAPVINSAAIPQIIPTATSRHLDQAGPWSFRLVANDSVEAEFLVGQIAARPSLHRVLLLFVNDAYGQGLRTALHDAIDRAGLTLTAELSVSAQSDFDALFLSEFRERDPDVIIGAFRNPDLASAGAALVRLGSRRPVFVSDGAYGPRAFHERVPRPAFAVFGAAFWLPVPGDSGVARFRASFSRVTGWDPRPEDVMIHDALVLAAYATRESQGDPRQVRRWLLSLGAGRPPFPGVGGPIDLQGPNRHPFHLGRFIGNDAERADLP
jgi:ABC-type branched-subunit amino acid transport system substrate-binding protein